MMTTLNKNRKPKKKKIWEKFYEKRKQNKARPSNNVKCVHSCERTFSLHTYNQHVFSVASIKMSKKKV